MQRLVTPYQTLSIAVRNEERAFAFWSYVSADAADPAIRREAERMAGEELQHVARLRGERRRAFHEARARTAVADRPGGVRRRRAGGRGRVAPGARGAEIAARLEAMGTPPPQPCGPSPRSRPPRSAPWPPTAPAPPPDAAGPAGGRPH